MMAEEIRSARRGAPKARSQAEVFKVGSHPASCQIFARGSCHAGSNPVVRHKRSMPNRGSLHSGRPKRVAQS